ncbi:hypothetical protein DRN52_09045 [Thermococci archaeon]|nr:MAG: hypothetical protein DRN52_09045 [Thermococci archaeon]
MNDEHRGEDFVLEIDLVAKGTDMDYVVAKKTLTYHTSAEAGSQETPLQVEYTAFNGRKYVLYAWFGDHVVFLTPYSNLDLNVMEQICQVFDRVYEYYCEMTGREPQNWPTTTIDGRMTIAVVEDTCGAGCGYLGYKGIEIKPKYFQILYEGVRDRNEFDQVVFYEFGRNFWFYGDQIGGGNSIYSSVVTNGYAVFMRFMAVEAVGVRGGPFRGMSWEEFRHEVELMLERYLSNPDLNWYNTLRVNQAPENPAGLTAADLFASFLFALYHQYGGQEFVKRLWHEVGRLPKASDDVEAACQFIQAASIAAGRDLTDKFREWRWPIPEEVGLQHTYGVSSGWYLVSVPTEGDTASVFGVTLYHWNGTNYDTLSGSDALEPGKGYWAYLPANASVTASGTVPTTDVVVALGVAGWHMVSAPWSYSKSDIVVIKGVETKTWADAVAAGWVLDTIYTYDPVAGNYTTPSTLDPWYGYWVRTYEDGISLKFEVAKKLTTSCACALLAPKALETESLPPAPPSMKALANELDVANFPNPITDVHTTTFKVLGPMASQVEEMRVRIFDLAGRLVWEGEAYGPELVWHTDNLAGQYLANGVYLYQVQVKVGGTWITTSLKKLAIYR